MPHFHDTSTILYIGFNIFERPLYRERHQCCSILSMLKEMSLFIIWILIMYRKTKRYLLFLGFLNLIVPWFSLMFLQTWK